MNERIKELIEQATESTGFLTAGDSVKPLPVREFNKVKFAELIVRECVSVIDSQGGRKTPRDYYSDYYIHQIKKHFEIKE